MTLHLTAQDIHALANDEVTLKAARQAIAAEAAARTVLPPRIDLPSQAGFLRVMPAVLDGVMGLKVMTLAERLGTRYLILLYDVTSGSLRGVVDAGEVTRLRTAAFTAVAGQVMVPAPPALLGLIGSGFEAAGHLRVLARIWPLEQVLCYSRTPERCAAFTERMSSELGIDVLPVSRAKATAEPGVVMLATKSAEPVVNGGSLSRGAVVLSIGSTRPDLRELDRRTLARAGTLVVDDQRQVLLESGDVIDAVEHKALSPERIVPISRCLDDRTLLRSEAGHDLLVFKSVGTALQDLSLALALLEAAEAADRGRDLGELCSLKPFAGAGG